MAPLSNYKWSISLSLLFHGCILNKLLVSIFSFGAGIDTAWESLCRAEEGGLREVSSSSSWIAGHESVPANVWISIQSTNQSSLNIHIALTGRLIATYFELWFTKPIRKRHQECVLSSHPIIADYAVIYTQAILFSFKSFTDVSWSIWNWRPFLEEKSTRKSIGRAKQHLINLATFDSILFHLRLTLHSGSSLMVNCFQKLR